MWKINGCLFVGSLQIKASILPWGDNTTTSRHEHGGKLFYLQDLNLDNLFIICSEHGDVVRIEWRVCDCEGMRSVQCRPPETNIHVTSHRAIHSKYRIHSYLFLVIVTFI